MNRIGPYPLTVLLKGMNMKSYLTALTLLCLAGPIVGQENTKTFTYTKTKEADLEMVVHFPPGWKESDKRPGIVFFFGPRRAAGGV